MTHEQWINLGLMDGGNKFFAYIRGDFDHFTLEDRYQTKGRRIVAMHVYSDTLMTLGIFDCEEQAEVVLMTLILANPR